MSAEVIKKWMIAALKANTGVQSLQTNIVSGNLFELPSENGVFVAASASSEESRGISDSQEMRVIAQAESEQAALTLLNAISDLFSFNPGEERDWTDSATPSDHSLLLKDISVVTRIDPQGVGHDVFVGTIVYRVRGRDTRRV